MVIGKDSQPEPKRRKTVLKRPIEVRAKQDAATVAYTATADGFTVDTSYMQVNSGNLLALGFTVEDIFGDCKDLAVGASALSAFYACALRKYPDPRTALRVALPAYNTNGFSKGHLNGYSARYGIGNPVVSMPTINPYTADTTVFVRQSLKKGEAMSTKEEASSTQQIVEPAKAMAPRIDLVMSQLQENGAIPGVQVEYIADAAGADGMLRKTATSKSDAWGPNTDLVDDPSGTAITLEGKVVHPAVPRSATDLVKVRPVKGDN